MQTVASFSSKLDMVPEKALELLQYMLIEVDGVDAALSDEQCDMLIDAADDASVAESIRNAKLKEQEKEKKAALRAEKKEAAAKRAAAKKKEEEEEEKRKKAEEAEAQRQAALAESGAAETATAAEVESSAAEIVTAEAVAPSPGPVAEPHPEEAEKVKRAVAEIVSAEDFAKKEAADRKRREEKSEHKPSIVIGSAIDHEARTVEILRADGTKVDIPDAEGIGVAEPASEEEEEEESGLLAEAQRRQEEEERRKTKESKPLPQPDPAVVAEVIRRAKEVKQGRARREERPVRATKSEKQDKAIRTERDTAEVREPVRRATATGKTARKRQKKVERARLEETMRRQAALAVREYEAGGLGPKKKRRRRSREDGTDMADMAEAPEIIEVSGKITVESLAEAMDVSVNELILELMDHDILATKNQTLDIDLVRKLAEPRGFEVKAVIPEEVAILAEEEDDPASLRPRSPVVTVMGHVDHGKTTFLDAVRSSKVAEGEAGGITQHIAAYDVPVRDGRVVFLDTPGHEAFTQMRARGARATDIVVLVVAADDGVMPQTIEAIDHAKAAEVPIVVAVNKCDKPDAQPDRIRQELTRFDLVDEAWGGKTTIRNISAKTGEGVDEFLEVLLIEAEMLELKANPNKRARGIVIESEISKSLGPVAWVLVQNGTLHPGDVFLAGESWGRVRTLTNSRGENVSEASPATPVVVTGFSAPPDAGTLFVTLEDERVARNIAEQRTELNKQKQGSPARHVTLEDFHERLLAGEKQQLNVVFKADVQGSVDVLESSLVRLGNDEVSVSMVHSGIGSINESDVLLASASDAVVIGFNVTASGRVKKLAETEGVDIRTYRIIYEVISDVKAALEGMLAPEKREQVTGHADIRAVFRSSAVGNVAGCHVTDGEIGRGAKARLLRDGQVLFDGKIGTLRREKDDVRSVVAGLDCGIKLDNWEDVREGDVIEAYRIEEIAKVLA